MVRIRPLLDLTEADVSWAGSKAMRLGRLARAGFSVPAGVAIGAEAYQQFAETTGVNSSIQLLLHRKKFEDMRWEEIWDLALRVRNLFVRTSLPDDLKSELEAALAADLSNAPVVVRSAGLSEDSQAASFAGLHDSFINVRGTEEILDKTILVWASLWSDRALLYRQELGLDPQSSRMAVIVQQFVVGAASGVAFSQSPSDPGELMVEGVWGLNQAMVDGTVPPHRWQLDRSTGRVKKTIPSGQTHELRASAGDARLVALDPSRQGGPPLADAELRDLYDFVKGVERLFGAPQDVEWTLTDNGFVVLQSRPITATGGHGDDDKRRWYLTLHRSVDNLKALRTAIRDEILPGMDREAEALAGVDLSAMDESALALEIRRRLSIRDRWIEAYWQHCIPFAHGMRIFGQVYNDRCKPEDPFEFVQLLKNDDLLGAQRNAEMQGLSLDLREVRAERMDSATFHQKLDGFLRRYGLTAVAGRPRDRDGLLALIARLPRDVARPAENKELQQRFLDRFGGQERESMAELLEIARDSYTLRDDDNIYLGRIEAELVGAVRHAEERVESHLPGSSEVGSAAELVRILEDPAIVSLADDDSLEVTMGQEQFSLRARQLVGQPASAGLAVGPARVLLEDEDLLSFQEGEILVCDAIDPNMTFVAPLAAGVVERRGGMLVHGAIIAREYGIPCVTGVPDATSWIRSGDIITVDGYLGLVIASGTGS